MDEINHDFTAIFTFWASVMIFALAVFGVILFSCAEGAQPKDKSGVADDTATYGGGSACVAGCGAACGG